MLNNYPNPFNPSTVISCALPSEIIAQNTAVAIEIFNAKGQKVTRLEVNLSDASTDASQGFNTVTTTWNGSDNSNRPVASGLYYYRLQAGNTTLAQSKMLLMK
jgi:flagellar hook assembly protein FlgD